MIARLKRKKSALFSWRNCAVEGVDFLVFYCPKPGKRCCEAQNSSWVSTKLVWVPFN